jgi:uroporphyrinogen decarboxylase
MTGYERTLNMLKRQPIDRIPVYEHFWNDTHRIWTEKGYIPENMAFADFFSFDMDEISAFKFVADLDFTPQIVEETDETVLTRDGNGALLRRHKLHDTTPEHVDSTVNDREGWERHIKPLLKPCDERINYEGYAEKKKICREKERFFFFSCAHVFECLHPVCGHEHMLAGMALDPDWVRDMSDTYGDLIYAMMEMLFDKEGLPDGVWFYEDMGFLGRPFMSPQMYREIIRPAHKKTIELAHSYGLPVVMHSCGMVEKLLPGMLEAGIDCLQVIEVKAGMDLLKLHKQYGDRLSFMGGIDIREVYPNDLARIDRELESKIPIVKNGFGYSLHSDHSIPATVDMPTYRYFIDKGIELGTY